MYNKRCVVETISDRITKLKKNRKFVDFCKHIRQWNGFDSALNISDRLVKLDISDVKLDTSKIFDKTTLSKSDMKYGVEEFFVIINNYAQSGVDLYQLLYDNAKYVVVDSFIERPCCSVSKDNRGNVTKSILLSSLVSIANQMSIIHEMTHSFCKSFIFAILPIDDEAKEYPTVASENLAATILQDELPEHKSKYVELKKFYECHNIEKSVVSVIDAMIVKIMTGEETIDTVQSKYSDVIGRNMHLLDWRLSDIENGKCCPMYEASYLVPRAVAVEVENRYKHDPKEGAKAYKFLIERNHDMYEGEILNALGLGTREDVIDDYANNFYNRIHELENEA